MIKRMELRIPCGRCAGDRSNKVPEWKQEDPYLKARVQILPEPEVVDPSEVEAAKICR